MSSAARARNPPLSRLLGHDLKHKLYTDFGQLFVTPEVKILIQLGSSI
jgi:hypothetical protein